MVVLRNIGTISRRTCANPEWRRNHSSIPFTWDPAERLLEEMWIARTLEISGADLVIGMKFPAYLVRHPNKVLWVLHQYRQAYDLWDAGQSNIPRTARGDEIWKTIRSADAVAFGETRALFTTSPTARDRIWHYNGIEAAILPQPLNEPELFVGGSADGYVFAGGRVGQGKRQALLISGAGTCAGRADGDCRSAGYPGRCRRAAATCRRTGRAGSPKVRSPYSCRGRRLHPW